MEQRSIENLLKEEKSFTKLAEKPVYHDISSWNNDNHAMMNLTSIQFNTVKTNKTNIKPHIAEIKPDPSQFQGSLCRVKKKSNTDQSPKKQAALNTLKNNLNTCEKGNKYTIKDFRSTLNGFNPNLESINQQNPLDKIHYRSKSLGKGPYGPEFLHFSYNPVKSYKFNKHRPSEFMVSNSFKRDFIESMNNSKLKEKHYANSIDFESKKRVRKMNQSGLKEIFHGIKLPKIKLRFNMANLSYYMNEGSYYQYL